MAAHPDEYRRMLGVSSEWQWIGMQPDVSRQDRAKIGRS
jgi:hypothetical protein